MKILGYVLVALAVTASIVGVAVSYQSLRRKDDHDIN
jgi:hypothetical protein